MSRLLFNLSLIICLLTSANIHAEQSEDGLVWVEAQVDVNEPYVQQTLIYTLRITSTAQVKTLSPTAPMLPGIALLEKLDQQPHFYTQQQQGTTYSISEFRYALTPLTFGQNRITPASVEVSYSNPASWNNYDYGYSAKPAVKKITLQSNVIELHVKPPAPSSQGDWLPLLALTLDGKLDKTPNLSIGEPFTITLTTNALGITGAQLPEPQLPLKPDDFKSYADRPQFGQRLVRNGSVLQGWRTDTYTLIPKRAGTLQIPELQMHWWSLREAQNAWTKWSAHIIPVLDPSQAPAAQEQKQPASIASNHLPMTATASNTGGVSWFWWWFSNLSILVLGWWLGAGRPGKAALYHASIQTSRWSRRHSLALWQKLTAYLRDLPWLIAYRAKLKTWQNFPKPWHKPAKNAPEILQNQTATVQTDTAPMLYRQTWWHKLLWRITPAPLRALQFLRAIDNEADPLRLSRLIQEFAHEQFKTPVNTPLLRLSGYFVQRCPRLDAVALQRLLKQLDQQHYDRPNQFKAREWKAEFQRILQYLPLRHSKARERQRQRLPALNPL